MFKQGFGEMFFKESSIRNRYDTELEVEARRERYSTSREDGNQGEQADDTNVRCLILVLVLRSIIQKVHKRWSALD